MTSPRLLRPLIRHVPAALALALLLSLLPAAAGAAGLVDLEGILQVLDEEDAVHSDNMRHVANRQWDDSLRGSVDGRTVDAQGGTDVEFATIDGRDYAVAGTYRNGLQIIDITDPEAPEIVTSYDCQILQGDVQTFSRVEEVDGEEVTRHYATYTADSGYTHRQSACYTDAGIDFADLIHGGDGTLIIDITDPASPVTVAFVEIDGGSHNQTVHPSGDYLYNSNSGGCGTCIEVFDIADFDAIEQVATIELTADDSHDLTFNAEGTRAYSAAIAESVIIDTSDPANPVVIAQILDPAVTLHHQIDPVTIGDREFVVINDELGGAAGNEVCPGGGLHVWETTGEMETDPVKVGAFFTPEITIQQGAPSGTGGLVTCTSHVFRVYEEQQKLVIGWFGAGVHVIDLSGLADAPVALSAGILGQSVGIGMAEVGFYRFSEDSDVWSAKVMSWDEDGSAYIFADDQSRGFDVFHFDNTAPVAEEQGTWLTPVQALQRTQDLLATGFVPRSWFICDLSRGRA